jgi:hypothetical protein
VQREIGLVEPEPPVRPADLQPLASACRIGEIDDGLRAACESERQSHSIAGPALGRGDGADSGRLAEQPPHQIDRVRAEVVQDSAFAGAQTMPRDGRPAENVEMQSKVELDRRTQNALRQQIAGAGVSRPETPVEVDHEAFPILSTVEQRQLLREQQRLFHENRYLRGARRAPGGEVRRRRRGDEQRVQLGLIEHCGERLE